MYNYVCVNASDNARACMCVCAYVCVRACVRASVWAYVRGWGEEGRKVKLFIDGTIMLSSQFLKQLLF